MVRYFRKELSIKSLLRQKLLRSKETKSMRGKKFQSFIDKCIIKLRSVFVVVMQFLENENLSGKHLVNSVEKELWIRTLLVQKFLRPKSKSKKQRYVSKTQSFMNKWILTKALEIVEFSWDQKIPLKLDDFSYLCFGCF